MKKKYFFFDIDGTLTNKQTGEIVPSAKETIRKLKEKEHFVAIASGRAYYKVVDFAKEMGIDNIVANGGAAIAVNNELVINEPLNKEKAVKLCHQAKELGYGVLIAFDDSINVFMNDETFINQVGYRKEPTRYFYDSKKSYEDIKDIYKIYIAVSQEEEHLLTLKDTIGHIRFVDSYLTFQHDKKDEGIEKMIHYIDGDNSEVVVFGDDYNDLVMFKDKWTCIAMGNGCEELKEKANFVTKESINDGIQYACQYFGWIEE